MKKSNHKQPKRVVPSLLLLLLSSSSSCLQISTMIAMMLAVARQPHTASATFLVRTSSKIFSPTSLHPWRNKSNKLQRPFLDVLYSSTISDHSAMSQSRPPFRMPRNSPDDSKIIKQKPTDTSPTNELAWNRMGLWTEVVDALENELNLKAPTPIQQMVIPELLKFDENQNIAFLAATGSGKTLAYLLPLLQQLKQQEVFENYERRSQRPRVLILAPTRELVVQITSVIKSISHTLKVSSQSLVGGQERGKQRKKLLHQPVDVLVATPGRLLHHWKKDKNVFLGNVHSVVLDEMDTMLEQGFQRELREILYPLLYSRPVTKKEPTPILKDHPPRIILTSATMTQAVQKLVGDNPKTSKLQISAKKNYVKRFTSKEDKQSSQQPIELLTEPYQKLQLPKMDKILTAPGLHKAIPRLEQIFVDVGQTDKMSLLIDILASTSKSNSKQQTIVFCNTASSVQAVQFALAEAKIDTLSYHGELNSAARLKNLDQFRGEANNCNILVCTDLAARGLDIPQVNHVVMFDFPLNALDYLHRSGRTARGNGRGKVTALVAKRDKVLATAIEQAVVRGDALDGLSSRKSDYLPGAKLGVRLKKNNDNNRSSNPPTSGNKRKPTMIKKSGGGSGGRRSRR